MIQCEAKIDAWTQDAKIVKLFLSKVEKARFLNIPHIQYGHLNNSWQVT